MSWWFQDGFGLVILTSIISRMLIGEIMLEELQTLLLVGLLVSTYYLTIGCRNIGEIMPNESDNISGKVDNATDRIQDMTAVLDDIANLLNEGLHAVADKAHTQMDNNPLGALLTGFISRMTSPEGHGKEPQDWEILPPKEQTTQETQDEFDTTSS